MIFVQFLSINSILPPLKVLLSFRFQEKHVQNARVRTSSSEFLLSVSGISLCKFIGGSRAAWA